MGPEKFFKTAAGFDRARIMGAGGVAPSVPTPAAKPKLDLAALKTLKAQQGLPATYLETPAAQQAKAWRELGTQDAARQFGLVQPVPLKGR